jgi:hypothetical protein
MPDITLTAQVAVKSRAAAIAKRRRPRTAKAVSASWRRMIGHGTANLIRFSYELGSTTLVTTQRCSPILRWRMKPSFSYVDRAPL